MNRSGLQNAAHELWDMPTAYLRGDDLVDANLDGGKVLWRYTPQGDANRECLETMTALAELVAETAGAGLPMFIEPLAVENKFDKWVTSKLEADWIRIVGVASSLGPTTARTWLKIPFLRPYERIVAATTLPILMLGGPATGVPAALLVDFADGMKAGPNVRGALVGRNILYPGTDDPAVVARAVCHIVHDGLSALESAQRAAESGRL
jgi:DhnA family fructose-bisphosphate aldolase class Ia